LVPVPAQTSTATGVVQPAAAEDGGLQKMSTKRRSVDTADKVLMNSIEEEVID
jgi:hypothetical protein